MDIFGNRDVPSKKFSLDFFSYQMEKCMSFKNAHNVNCRVIVFGKAAPSNSLISYIVMVFPGLHKRNEFIVSL